MHFWFLWIVGWHVALLARTSTQVLHHGVYTSGLARGLRLGLISGRHNANCPGANCTYTCGQPLGQYQQSINQVMCRRHAGLGRS